MKLKTIQIVRHWELRLEMERRGREGVVLFIDDGGRFFEVEADLVLK